MAACGGVAANDAVTRLMGFYPAREVRDPKTFAAGMTALMATFPLDLVKRCIDPVEGLPSKLKWLPTLADVREFLDTERDRRARILGNARWTVQEAERRAKEAEEERRFEANRPSAEERARKVRELLGRSPNRFPEA